jgi:hypothetical protein
MLIRNIYVLQAIAVHTFIMVWCNRGFNAIKVAWIAMAIPWIFSVVYAGVIGAIYQGEPDTIYRPSPVRWVSRDLACSDTVSSVLVLDRQALSTPPPVWSISLDVDLPLHFSFAVYPLVFLGTRKHHNRRELLEFQNPQTKNGSR